MPAVILDRRSRFDAALARGLVRWELVGGSIEPKLLKARVKLVREQVGEFGVSADHSRFFELSVRRLADLGATSLRPRDDMLLAGGLSTASDTLEGDSIVRSSALLIPLLERWRGQVSDRVLGPLLWRSAFFAYFIAEVKETRLLLGKFLLETLPELHVGATAPAWVPIVIAHKQVLDSRPAQSYAKEWFKAEAGQLEEVRDHARIPATSWFWAEIVDELLLALTNLDDQSFLLHLPRALDLIDQHPVSKDKILATLLERYTQSASPVLHGPLLEKALEEWGNPQLDLSDRSHRWSQLSDRAVRIVCHWLAEDDLNDFFELIKSSSATLSDMDQRRFAYWKRFTGRMAYTKLVFGVGLRATTNRDIGRFISKRKGRLGWLNGSTPANIAILMKMDGWWFVEFGQTGNACFTYRDDLRPFDLAKKEFFRNELGNPDAVAASGQHRLIHRGDWEADFDQALSRLGIWPHTITGGNTYAPSQRQETNSNRYMDALNLGLSRSMNLELESIRTRVVDSRSKGGSYWVEINGKPSENLTKAMKTAGFRYANPRGFYR